MDILVAVEVMVMIVALVQYLLPVDISSLVAEKDLAVYVGQFYSKSGVKLYCGVEKPSLSGQRISS